MKTIFNPLMDSSFSNFALLKFNPIKSMNKLLFFGCMLFSVYMHPVNVAAQSLKFSGPVMYINLLRPAPDSPVLMDGTAAMYSNKFSSATDANDASKFYNGTQNIFLTRNGKNLSVEARQIPSLRDTLFIQTSALASTKYLLQIVPQNITDSMPGKAWLIDKYLNTKTSVDINNITLYEFIPDTNENSYLNRFILVFNRIRIASPLKITTNGFDKYDSIAKISKMYIYPNPVVGNLINLKFENVAKGDYNISITNGNGGKVFTNRLYHAGGNNNYSLVINLNKINSGVYTLMVSGVNNQKSIHLPLLINK